MGGGGNNIVDEVCLRGESFDADSYLAGEFFLGILRIGSFLMRSLNSLHFIRGSRSF